MSCSDHNVAVRMRAWTEIDAVMRRVQLRIDAVAAVACVLLLSAG